MTSASRVLPTHRSRVPELSFVPAWMDSTGLQRTPPPDPAQVTSALDAKHMKNIKKCNLYQQVNWEMFFQCKTFLGPCDFRIAANENGLFLNTEYHEIVLFA